MEILSKDNCINMDQYTINTLGIPSIVLMENAANSIVKEIKDIGKRVIVFCGTGNNGGDGLAIARKLYLIKKEVKVILVGNIDKLTEEAKINLKVAQNLNISIDNIKDLDEMDYIINDIKCADYVVDAIFGIGLNRSVKGAYSQIINLINKHSKFTVSVDIPSGLDANTGETLGVSIIANITYTIEVIKKGFVLTKAIDKIGKLIVVNIDIPEFVKKQNSEKTYILSEGVYKKMIPIRCKTGHKGSYGKILIVAGSNKYTGAAFITTEACVRTGSGLVTLLTHNEAAYSLKSRLIETMIKEYKTYEDVRSLSEFDVIACGPGFSTSEDSVNILEKILNETNCKLVLDADALNIISKNKGMLKKLSNRAIITPHPGELARLKDISIEEIECNRIDVARDFAYDNKIIVLLKGYNTVITDGTSTFINPTGNSKMASGGMGDCLTGIITSFLGQGINIINSAILGAYIHGYIGDELSETRYSINARDIIDELPKTIQKLCEK